jgi:hypothetical protein
MADPISKIEERNQRVEADKAWETSVLRISCIAILIYSVAVFFMYKLQIERVWFNALIPPIGYLLSTMSLSPLKRWWIRRYLANKE